MLAFMAYPPPRNQRDGSSNSLTAVVSNSNHQRSGSSSGGAFSTTPNACNDSMTTASMEDRPPQSVLSISTDASSAILQLEEEEETTRPPVPPPQPPQQEVHRRISTSSVEQGPARHQQQPQQQQQQERSKRPTTTQRYIEKIYENTVHGPCHVTMCELEHMDLFLNCQQPLSFLGFGHHPSGHSRMDPTASFHLERSYHYEGDHDNHYDEQQNENMAYAVPRGCEYCGAASTKDCVPETCSRPRLYFHKKRPPFAPPDPTKWDPDTDLAIRTGHTLPKLPKAHNQRNWNQDHPNG